MLYPIKNSVPSRAAASTQWLLDQPGRTAAESLIRQTRPHSYFKKWDAFTAGAASALGVSPHLASFMGATLGAGLDLIFDQHEEVPGLRTLDLNLRSLGRSAKRWTDPQYALCLSRKERVGGLEEAVATTLALITLGGLCGESNEEWLQLWQGWVSRTVQSQVATGLMSLDQVPAAEETDQDTLAPYLAVAAETDMAAIGIAGMLGYSERCAELLEPLRSFLPRIPPVIRLAADMAFDPTESVNCAVYLAAGELRLSLRHARERLRDDSAMARAVENRLIRVTRPALKELRRHSIGAEPEIQQLYRVVESAVLAEIEQVRSGHCIQRESREGRACLARPKDPALLKAG